MQWPEVNTGDYVAYHKEYIDRIPMQCNVPAVLEENMHKAEQFFNSIPEAKLSYRYAEDKWTIREVLGHIIDTERIMAYRALCIARGETQSLPGFDDKAYAAASNANDRSPGDLIAEFVQVRKSTIAMMRSFTPAMIGAAGIANGHRHTVNAICRIIAGHELHHVAIIKERYL